MAITKSSTPDVMAITKWSIPVEAISASLGMSQAFATSSPPPRSAEALLHPAEDIGSALKGGVNVCQRQLVNEVFGPLVTKFVRNFGREDATPYQRGSNGSLLGRIQAVKFIRHNTSCIFRAALPPSVARCTHQVQSFDLSQTFWFHGFIEQIFGADEQDLTTDAGYALGMFGWRRRRQETGAG
jgi:hypothetical protein